MVVNLSNEAKVLIQQYKKALLKSPYRCTKERSNELGKEMLDTIVKEASNADSLQVCPYKILGQEKDKDDKPINQNLRWFQYESPSSSVWGVSVMCDFEHDVATVHRIVHSSFIKESSMRWIPLQDFNKQINKVNTMKWKKLVNESQVDFELDYWVQGKISQAFDQFVQDKQYPATAQLKVYVGLYKTPKMDGWKIYRHARDTYEDAQEDIKSAQMDAKKHNIVDVQFKIEEITIDVSKRIETVYEG